MARSLDPIDDPQQIRQADAGLLARALAAQRECTLRLFDAVRAALGPQLEIRYGDELNPPLWELGHVGWFEEFWIARNSERLRGTAARLEAARAAPLLAGADALYNSSHVPHARRWHLDLPSAKRTLDTLARVRERTLALLAAGGADDDALYFFRLALMHEAMHVEADTMIAQVLALDVRGALADTGPAAAAVGGELDVPAAALTVGSDDAGFHFDNEFGAHQVDVPALRIDSAPVTWGAYLPFIAAGGYDEPRWWSSAGWAWRRHALPSGLPRYVARGDDGSLRRASFDTWTAIDPAQPAVNLSQHEAQAWCAWAGRRLPTEFEWLHARTHAGEAFAWGQVWEWTASPFGPWPGFRPHPYRDYSQPWFDGRPVLKGGSFATPACMQHPRYRNFFSAGRNDVFAGFRSCAL
ncbi:MAG: selenoneine synthase SenA [Burkholderiaceae bacterium]|nr:selenoneine synthase SenA [Burkholderiaceae bacterium]